MSKEPGGSDVCGDRCSKTCGPVEVPSAEEKEALDALRRIKDQVREIKEKLETARPDSGKTESGDAVSLKNRLETLRGEWDVWQGRLDVANRNRMVLLGHEEPD